MARIYIIRHGEPVSTWGSSGDSDPGLSPKGYEQANRAAHRLQELNMGRIVSSPLRRAQETAQPFSKLMDLPIKIEIPVAEIPSPAHLTMDQRGPWLRQIMQGGWVDAGHALQSWRQNLIDYLSSLEQDTAIFSHFVAINVAVGHAIGDDRVACFSPAHASITSFTATGKHMSLLELGETSVTHVG